MWVERLKIQYQIFQAWIQARRIDKKPIASVKEAIGTLERALKSLRIFNEKYPLIGKILRIFDRKLCIHPLNLQLARLKAKVSHVENVVRPHFSKPTHDLSLMKILVKHHVDLDKLLPELASIQDRIKNGLSDHRIQNFFSSLDWYWSHEGKESEKCAALIYICEAPEEFIKAVEYLQMNYGSLGQMKLADLDKALMDVLPGFSRCRLFLDSDLADLILMSVERWLKNQLSAETLLLIKGCLESMQKLLKGEQLSLINELLDHQNFSDKATNN